MPNGTVLITGATDGIGKLLATSYANSGFRVLATGRRKIEDVETFFSAPGISYVEADQSHAQQSAEIICRAISDLNWSGLDLAILNAAIGWAGEPQLEPASSVEQQIQINLTATIAIANAIAPHLFQTKGKLVLIGSSSSSGHAKFATYCATKSGLVALARSLRVEWQNKASVQIVHPGPTRTTMHAKAGLDVGWIGNLFMSPTSVSTAIRHAISSRASERTITRTYALFSGLRAGKAEKP